MTLHDLRDGYVWICVVVNNLYVNVAILDPLYVNFVICDEIFEFIFCVT
jgi:hypothetical protein